MSSSAGPNPNVARQEAARTFLFGRIDYERARNVPYGEQKFKLDRMRQLLDRLGNPHQAMPVIHVAGTKGKGSTAAMLGGILSAAGYRTGVFTSPHLDRVEERIMVDGQSCSADEFVDLVDRLRPAVDAMDKQAQACDPPDDGLTYFEMVTAMAGLHFAQRQADAAVLEVGLGGRLDSTNVCRPVVSVITSISFDHTEQLGNTLESIAREKAGILKPAVPVVSGVSDPGPRKVIREICGEQGCRLVELGVDFDVDYDPPRRLELAPSMGKIDFRRRGEGAKRRLSDVSLSLLGRHQAANAAVALAVVDELRRTGWNVPEEAIRAALADLEWPARVEVIARRPAVVLDTAHNLASIDALIRVLDESFQPARRLLLFATTLDKDFRGMLSRLAPKFDHVTLTRYMTNPRAVPPEELAAVAAELTGQPCQACATPAEAWRQVRALAGSDDLICATGSFFIAGELRHLIRTGREIGSRDGGPPTAP